jgi:hypothetical protein
MLKEEIGVSSSLNYTFSLTYIAAPGVINVKLSMRPSCIIISIVLFPFIFMSCNSTEIGNSKDVNTESIFLNYQVSGDEMDSMVTVHLRFCFAGPRGTTLVLNEPSKVELDGKTIPADSSRLGGAYYEMVSPVKEFTGRHTIIFTGFNATQYKEEFDFRPMSLRTKLPDSLQRGDLVLELDGLEPEDYVRVLMTDTSFRSEEINRLDTVRNGRIIITKKEMEVLVNGPVRLELFKEAEKPLKNPTREGGQLSINYGLKRHFLLKDSLTP